MESDKVYYFNIVLSYIFTIFLIIVFLLLLYVLIVHIVENTIGRKDVCIENGFDDYWSESDSCIKGNETIPFNFVLNEKEKNKFCQENGFDKVIKHKGKDACVKGNNLVWLKTRERLIHIEDGKIYFLYKQYYYMG